MDQVGIYFLFNTTFVRSFRLDCFVHHRTKLKILKHVSTSGVRIHLNQFTQCGPCNSLNKKLRIILHKVTVNPGQLLPR